MVEQFPGPSHPGIGRGEKRRKESKISMGIHFLKYICLI